MVGRVFSKDQGLDPLSVGSGSGEHDVSYTEANWMELRAAVGFPHPVWQCWVGEGRLRAARTGWSGGLLMCIKPHPSWLVGRDAEE